MTANVLMKKKIFCPVCGNYYKLHVHKKTVVSNKMIQSVMKQLLIFAVLAFGVYWIYYLDKRLKFVYQNK